MSKLYATLSKLAAMGNPGPMLSKNFLATPQLDVDLWTELLCTLCRENYPSRRVYRNRAIFESAYHCALTKRRAVWRTQWLRGPGTAYSSIAANWGGSPR